MQLPEDVAARSSVLRLPQGRYEQALAPVLVALCDCTHAGDHVDVVARVVPASGEVRASATGTPAVDACLARRLAPGQFEPFDAGKSDCVDCGPRRLPSPARPDKIADFAKVAPEAAAAAALAKPRTEPAPVASHVAFVFPFRYERPEPYDP